MAKKHFKLTMYFIQTSKQDADTSRNYKLLQVQKEQYKCILFIEHSLCNIISFDT